MKTFATLFTGGGGADCGLAAAGLTHLWGIEKNPAYAAIANLNGFKTLIQDVRSTDWMQLETPDWLHASPPCQRASAANPNKGETKPDRELAIAIVDAVETLKPEFFSLENVRGYRSFLSYRFIRETLVSAGYSVADSVLDAANYGVPQNRNRLWLVARRTSPAMLPHSTHGKDSDQLGLFFGTRPFVGWQEEIKHLPEPKTYELSERMKQMVPADFTGTALMAGWSQYAGRGEAGLTIRRHEEPSPTITAKMNRDSMRNSIITKRDGVIESRPLDLLHIAALQGFPKYYNWGESRPRAFEAIGNAVSPPMMHAIAQANIQAFVAA